MARLPRRVFPEHAIFHVTGRGVDSCDIYRADDDRRRFLRLLAGVADHGEWSLYAMCLMTTHYHLVVETERERLSSGMHVLNGIYAARFNSRYERTGHLFGDRFATWIVRDDDHLANTCTYVIENPVRAGLCKRPADWPWSWSRFGRDRG